MSGYMADASKRWYDKLSPERKAIRVQRVREYRRGLREGTIKRTPHKRGIADNNLSVDVCLFCGQRLLHRSYRRYFRPLCDYYLHYCDKLCFLDAFREYRPHQGNG